MLMSGDALFATVVGVIVIIGLVVIASGVLQ